MDKKIIGGLMLLYLLHVSRSTLEEQYDYFGLQLKCVTYMSATNECLLPLHFFLN